MYPCVCGDNLMWISNRKVFQCMSPGCVFYVEPFDETGDKVSISDYGGVILAFLRRQPAIVPTPIHHCYGQFFDKATQQYMLT